MNVEKKRLKQRAAIVCWMRSSLTVSVRVRGYRTTQAYSSLDLNAVKYNMYVYSIDEKVNVTLQTRPNNLIQWENM
jgi:hypothetical protein